MCPEFLLFEMKMNNIIFLSYHMTQKISGLLKNFWIAMLPCYRGFSLSALPFSSTLAPLIFSSILALLHYEGLQYSW